MKEREELLAREEAEKESRIQEQLLQQLEREALRKEELRREERERQKARRRALSDATEKPAVETCIEIFDSEIEAFGVHFDTVRLYHERRGMRLLLALVTHIPIIIGRISGYDI